MNVRTQEEWHELVVAYRTSQESMSIFCKRNDINTSTLHYWLAKTKEKTAAPGVKLLPVVAVDETRNMVELILPKGMSLRFAAGASVRYVADMIKALV